MRMTHVADRRGHFVSGNASQLCFWRHENPGAVAGMPARPGEPGPVSYEDARCGRGRTRTASRITRTARRPARARSRWSAIRPSPRTAAARRSRRRSATAAPRRRQTEVHAARDLVAGERRVVLRRRMRRSTCGCGPSRSCAATDHLLTYLDGKLLRERERPRAHAYESRARCAFAGQRDRGFDGQGEDSQRAASCFTSSRPTVTNAQPRCARSVRSRSPTPATRQRSRA